MVEKALSTFSIHGAGMVSQRSIGKGAQQGHESRDSWAHQGLGRGLSYLLKQLLQLMAGFGQVQLEVQKKWRQWHLQEFPLRPVALSNSFSNATSGTTHGTKASTLEQSRGTSRASII